MIRCTNCSEVLPAEGNPYKCNKCGGLYDFDAVVLYDQEQATVDEQVEPGIWRFRNTFGLFSEIESINLGEGRTPLVWVSAFDTDIGFKLEYLNPTGSFAPNAARMVVEQGSVYASHAFLPFRIPGIVVILTGSGLK
jgi:threonine synthase